MAFFSKLVLFGSVVLPLLGVMSLLGVHGPRQRPHVHG